MEKGTVPLRRTILLAAAVLAAALFISTAPPAPTLIDPTTTAATTVRGAFHIHTTRSDGTLVKAEVAAAARRAGLQFAIFTDHGDGSDALDPPAYIDDVLCIDGVEISATGGHYAAVGLERAPYPLGGDAEAVVEDVRRLGGFGVAAHPGSARRELAWTDWSAPIDGLEWLNADSEWRDESRVRLSRALLDYLWRPAGALASLLDRPVATLAHWDRITSTRPIVGLAGHDAHGGFGAEVGARGDIAVDGTPNRWPRRRISLPSYESTFRTFSLVVNLPRAPSGRALEDADVLIGALRAGRVFTAVDALASPATLDFEAVAGTARAGQGESLPMSLGRAEFRVRTAAPAGSSIVLLRDGRAIGHASGEVLTQSVSSPGVFRVEVHAPDAPGRPPVPWLVSNPIYRWPAASGAGAPVGATSEAPSEGAMYGPPLAALRWRVETSQGSRADVTAEPGSVSVRYALGAGARASQFVALAADLKQRIADSASELVLKGDADRPMRVSVQLRFGAGGEVRWGKSVYLDNAEREIRVPLDRLGPLEGVPPMPPLSRAAALLFVVDLTNARPGATGQFTLRSGS